MTDSLMRRAILDSVEAHRDEIISLLSDLIRFPSVNKTTHGDEAQCQQFVEETLRAMQLEVDVFTPDEIPGIADHPGWTPGRDYTDRPNVVGVRKGVEAGRSLLLSAHVDVVPEGPHELWRHGPFNPVVENGALIGRGSNDDKGGLAALIMALKCVESAGYRPAGDVILASVVDEESGGANGTLAVLLRGYSAAGAVNCDGIDLNLHTANLGGAFCSIHLHLQPRHAVDKVDKVMKGVLAVYHDMMEYSRERAEILQRDPRFAGSLWLDLAVRVAYVEVGSADFINPSSARIDVAFYIFPGEEPAQVQAQIEERIAVAVQNINEVAAPRVEWNGRVMPPSSTPGDHLFVNKLAAAWKEASGKPAVRSGMPMSDLFQFNLHSPQPMPTVSMGPGRWGVPGSAHQPNESVLIDEGLVPFVKTLALLIVDWCGAVST